MNFTTILLQATAIMAALLALRPLLKRYAPPRARCALWAIPALRLIFPFEIRSGFSLLGAAEPVLNAVNTMASQPVTPSEGVWFGNNLPNPAPIQPAAPTVDLGDILLVVWLIGAVVTAALILRANFAFMKSAKRLAVPFEADCPLPVYMLSKLASPCLAGVFRPRIYINERAAADETTLRMTLLHEMTHYKRLDHVWGLVRGVLTVVFWFHPLVWVCGECYRRDCETACDESATRTLAEDKKQEYGLALIALAGRRKTKGEKLLCMSTAYSGKKLLRERIASLARSRRWVKTAAAASLILAVVLVFTMCTAPAETPDTDTVTDSTPNQNAVTPVTPSVPGELVADTGKPEPEPAPRPSGYGTAADAAYYLEFSSLGAEFNDVDPDVVSELLAEYGDLLTGYTFIARGRVDGKGVYLVGEYDGDQQIALFTGSTPKA